MDVAFIIIAVITLGSAVAAMAWRNLVHCALCLAVTFAGIAALFLKLNAQFIGFAQVLVYVGAVAILILFAILLTRGEEPLSHERGPGPGWLGLAIALLMFLCLAAAVVSIAPRTLVASTPASLTVRQIGECLMSDYILPLEVVGLLLTAALIGAVVIAMHDRVEPAVAAEKRTPGAEACE